jgi:hypothetical protein
MKFPWTDLSGIARWITAIATIFLVLLGLCGANVAAFLAFAPDFISEDPHHKASLTSRILGWTGYAELCGMVICLALLGTFSLIGIVQFVRLRQARRRRRSLGHGPNKDT